MKMEYTANSVFDILKAYIGNNSYTTKTEFIDFCSTNHPGLPPEQIRKFLTTLEKRFAILFDPDGRLYLTTIYQKEYQIACKLHELLDGSPTSVAKVEEHSINGLELSEEQNEAIKVAEANYLSLVLGHTGSGRATLLRALIASHHTPPHFLICAPDAKTADDFSTRIGRPVEELDIALELKIPEPCIARDWSFTEYVIVWDAQRMNLDQFITLLERRNPRTRIVLFGDTNDLQCDTPGNILPDLEEIGIPTTRLLGNYSFILHPTALTQNIGSFENISFSKDFDYDTSFMFVDRPDGEALENTVARIYTSAVTSGEEVQVITPYGKRYGSLSAYKLGCLLENYVHLSKPGRAAIVGPQYIRELSRVMIVNDDWTRNCRAGDIGTLRCLPTTETLHHRYCVEFDDGRTAYWDTLKDSQNITLAYALTPYQARNNFFDTIIVPLSDTRPIPSRREIYSAMVRAHKKLIFVGKKEVLNKALQNKDSRMSSISIRFNDSRFFKS